MSSQWREWDKLIIYLKTSCRSGGCVWVGSSQVQFDAACKAAAFSRAVTFK